MISLFSPPLFITAAPRDESQIEETLEKVHLSVVVYDTSNSRRCLAILMFDNVNVQAPAITEQAQVGSADRSRGSAMPGSAVEAASGGVQEPDRAGLQPLLV